MGCLRLNKKDVTGLREIKNTSVKRSDFFLGLCFHCKEKSCKNTLVSMSIRILLSIAVTATAVSLPFFARVVGFIGAFCSCFVSIVFPVAAALVLLKNEMSRLHCVFAWCVLIFGSVCTIWGTVAVFVSPV